MDHVVYLDSKAKELKNILKNGKRMIIRGATGRKIPYKRVNIDDILYFINNNAEGVVKAKAVVKSVFNSDKMDKEESIKLVEEHQNKLMLTERQFKRWAGKRYLILIEIDDIEKVQEFEIDKSEYSNVDDWLIVEDINNVIVV